MWWFVIIKNLVTSFFLQKWVSMFTHSAFRFFCWWCSMVRAFSTSTSRKLGQFCRYSTNQYSFNHASCFCPGVTFYWYCIFICFIQSIAAVIVFIFCCCKFYKCKFTLLQKKQNSVRFLQICFHWNVSLKVLADFLANSIVKLWKVSASRNVFAWLS